MLCSSGLRSPPRRLLPHGCWPLSRLLRLNVTVALTVALTLTLAFILALAHAAPARIVTPAAITLAAAAITPPLATSTAIATRRSRWRGAPTVAGSAGTSRASATPSASNQRRPSQRAHDERGAQQLVLPTRRVQGTRRCSVVGRLCHARHPRHEQPCR